jgi:hypothetical protein
MVESSSLIEGRFGSDPESGAGSGVLRRRLVTAAPGGRGCGPKITTVERREAPHPLRHWGAPADARRATLLPARVRRCASGASRRSAPLWGKRKKRRDARVITRRAGEALLFDIVERRMIVNARPSSNR